MAEYIDKEAFKKSVEERYCKPCKAEKKDHNGCWCRACWVDDMIDEVECFQPADVAPVVYGKWVFGGDGCVICSECNEEESNDNHRKYCPNCGVKMGGKGGGDDRA